MKKEEFELSDSVRGHIYTTFIVLAFFGILTIYLGNSDMAPVDYLFPGGVFWLVVRYFVFASNLANEN